MVFWGTTVGGRHERKGKFRDILDLKNAALLGFDSEDTFSQGFGNNIRSNIQKQVHSLMMTALEVDRYFVILRAFDFQASWKEKKTKLLWETRFSIDQRRNAFDASLPVMAQYASQAFGQDSKGLLLAQVSDGRVELGEVKSLGEVNPPQK
jgi:diphthamide biosynthesis methyltransferase